VYGSKHQSIVYHLVFGYLRPHAVRFYFLLYIKIIDDVKEMVKSIVQVKELKIGKGHPTRIMGVINLSPESFYKESVVSDEEYLLEIIKVYEKEGADMIDVGAASSSPLNIYSRTETDIEEEYKRISQFLETIIDNTQLPISIDTTSARVAEYALKTGVALINDISGLHHDKEMARIAAEYEVPIVLMANCKKPCNSINESVYTLRESLKTARVAGIEKDQIIIDPGIGFGKPTEIDVELIQNLRVFSNFEHPVLVGVSRKAFIGQILDLPNPEDRLLGSIAATAIAVTNGADIIRTHDVKEGLVAADIGKRFRGKSSMEYNRVELIDIQNSRECEIILERIGVSARIRKSLARKSSILNILLKDIRVPAALIIKQEMLALGGDAAYHHDTIDFGIDKTDVLLMGTNIQIDRLCDKMAIMDYFGLDKIGNSIRYLVDKNEEL
jgi:dihydropteroate synthase